MLSALWRDELREEDHTMPFDDPMIPEVTKLNHPCV